MNCFTKIFVMAFSMLVQSVGLLGAGEYHVVSFVSSDDPYYAVAMRLAQLRDAAIVTVQSDRLDELKTQLTKQEPEYVAFVLRPDQIDVNQVQKLLRLATEMDDDPFVDFAYGLITGRSPQAALQLVEAGNQPPIKSQIPEMSMLGVGDANQLKQSQSVSFDMPLGKQSLRFNNHFIAYSSTHPEKRDEPFILDSLKKMQGQKLITLVGHGYPDRIVGGPTWKDISTQSLDGAVIYNIACYTGVTADWYEIDWKKASAGETYHYQW